MMSERSRYRAMRMTVGLLGFGSLAAVVAMAVQQWNVIAPILQPSTLGCGCQNIVIQASPWMTGWTSILLAVSLVLIGRLGWFLIRQIRRQRDLIVSATREGQVMIDPTTQIPYLLVPGPEAQAMTIGVFQSNIIVTQGLHDRLSPAERSAVLKHEQAHQHAHDPAWSAVLDSLGATWFWLPWFRTWIQATFRLRELAADEVATRGFHETEDLGQAVLKLVVTEPQAIPAFSANRDRVEKLLNRSWRPQFRLWRWPSVISAAVLVLGMLAINQISAETARAVETTPAGVCQETRIMCLQPQAPTRTTVCIERNGWQCVFMPAMTSYGFAITPR